MPKRNSSEMSSQVTFSQTAPASKKARTTPRKKVAKASKTQEKYFSKERALELKTLVSTPNYTVSATGGYRALVNMSIGASNSQRLGQKIMVKSIHVDVGVQIPTASLATVGTYPDNSDGIRVVVVRDKQSNGADFSWSDVFQSSGSANAPYMTRNLGNIDRFDVLADFRGMFSSASTNGLRFTRYIKCNLPVHYNGGNAGTVADIATGNIAILAADENTGGALFSNLYGVVEIKYADD